jgi:hypothetical protein
MSDDVEAVFDAVDLRPDVMRRKSTGYRQCASVDSRL